MSLCWISACSSHWTPCGMWIVFIFRTILQAFISHLKCISHGNDSALMFTQMCSQRGKSLRISQREIWWWSNKTFFIFLLIQPSHSIFFCFLSLIDTLSLSNFLHLSRSPPRPSPGSLHYSDEDVSTKYNDLIPAESSSLTEKPSEISDSQVSIDTGLQPMSSLCLE